MKKILLFFLLAIFGISLVSCGSEATNDNNQNIPSGPLPPTYQRPAEEVVIYKSYRVTNVTYFNDGTIECDGYVDCLYTYDDNENLIKFEQIHYSMNDEITSIYRKKYEYDGKLLVKYEEENCGSDNVAYSGRIETYEYDECGNMIIKNVEMYYEGNQRDYSKYEYMYDAQNYLVKIIYKHILEEGTERIASVEEFSYEYNHDYKILKQTRTRKSGNNLSVEYIEVIEYKYDSNWKIIEEKEYPYGGESDCLIYTYANGSLIEECQYIEGKVEGKCIYEYNESNKLIYQKYYDSENLLDVIIDYQYDENGNLVLSTSNVISENRYPYNKVEIVYTYFE